MPEEASREIDTPEPIMFGFGYEDSETIRDLPEALEIIKHPLGYVGLRLSQLVEAQRLNPAETIVWALNEKHTKPKERLSFAEGAVVLDVTAMRLNINQKDVYITPTEYKLLEVFMRHEGILLTKGQLLELVWDFEKSNKEDPNVVETFVSYCRKKLGSYRYLIQNRRGFGYLFVDKPADEGATTQS